jgi:hypothetical protein
MHQSSRSNVFQSVLLATVLATLTPTAPAAATDRLVSLGRNSNEMWTVTTDTYYADIAHDVTFTGVSVCNRRGFATQPTTGTFFASIWLNGCEDDTRTLFTIDPVTGDAVLVGDLGTTTEKIASLTFGADQSTLYGVTEDYDTAPHTLFSIDPADGTLTQRCTLPSGYGEGLAFADGRIFFLTQDAGDSHTILLSIDPAAFPVDETDPCPATSIDNDLTTGATGMTARSLGGGSVEILFANFSFLFSITIPGESDPSDYEFLTYLSDDSDGLAFSDAAISVGNLTVSTAAMKYRSHGSRYVEYTISAHNAGPDSISDVTVGDYTPDGTQVYALGAGCTLGYPVTCDIGTLDSGETTNVTLTVEVLCKKCSTVYNAVVIETADEAVWEDPNDNFYNLNTAVKGKF